MSANMGVKHQMDQNFKKGKKRGGLRDLPGRRVLMLLSTPPGVLVPPSIPPGYHCNTRACPGRGEKQGEH